MDLKDKNTEPEDKPKKFEVFHSGEHGETYAEAINTEPEDECPMCGWERDAVGDMWVCPNPNCPPEPDKLTPEQRDWIMEWMQEYSDRYDQHNRRIIIAKELYDFLTDHTEPEDEFTPTEFGWHVNENQITKRKIEEFLEEYPHLSHEDGDMQFLLDWLDKDGE